MGLTATVSNREGGGDYAKPPTGNHPAVLVAIVDMGTQWQEGYQGEQGSWQHRAYFVWELVSEPIPGKKGENHLIGIDLTVSLHKKAKLRQWVEAWTGKQIADGTNLDVTTLLGNPCLLNVSSTAKGYPKIIGASAMPRGLPCPAAKRQPYSWNLEQAGGDPAKVVLPDWLPYFYGRPLAETVRASKELAGDKATAKEPGPAPAAGGKPAPRPAPRPGGGVRGEPPDDSRWEAYLGEEHGWFEMSGKQIREWMQANDYTAAAATVRRMNDTDDGKPASDWGFKDPPIPF